MIRLNVSEEQLETGVGLEKVVQQIFWYQIFWRDAIGKDIRLINLQKEMYESGSFIKINRKKLDCTHNLLKPLCDTATSTFIGRVPDIVTTGSDKDKSRISSFALKQKHNDFEEEIRDVGLNASICGSGFLGLYADIGDEFPHYRSLDPRYTNVVYDCSIAQKRLFAYTIYYEAINTSDNYLSGRYVCIIYTKDKMFAYYTNQISIPTKMAYAVYPLELFMIDGVERSYASYHGFSDIPIIEFQNNKLCLSDCKPALPQIAMYSALQNNRFQNVDDIINYLLVITNARLGDDKEINAAMSLIKNDRVLPLEGEHVDAKFLSNPLNQTDIQKLADDYKKEIHYITHIPDLSSVDFSQNASEPVIKIKTKPLLDLCQEKELWFNKGYWILLELTLDFVKENSKKLYEEVGFNLDKCDLVYSHTLPSNDGDMVNNIVNLGNQGLLDPRVALQGLSFIPNVDDYLKGVKEYNDYVDTRKEIKENKDKGLNETNLQRQNEKPQSADQFDNKMNAIKGIAQELSVNKVN